MHRTFEHLFQCFSSRRNFAPHALPKWQFGNVWGHFLLSQLEGTTDIYQAEARNAAESCPMHRTARPSQEWSGPKCKQCQGRAVWLYFSHRLTTTRARTDSLVTAFTIPLMGALTTGEASAQGLFSWRPWVQSFWSSLLPLCRSNYSNSQRLHLPLVIGLTLPPVYDLNSWKLDFDTQKSEVLKLKKAKICAEA